MKRIEVRRYLVNVTVAVDYGYGPQLALSVPTGALAGYQEARDANMAQCNRQVDARVAELVKRCPSVEVVTIDMN